MSACESGDKIGTVPQHLHAARAGAKARAAVLLLIAAARLCTRNCYGGFIVEACYPAAYIEGDMLRLLALALLALTLIARACRKE